MHKLVEAKTRLELLGATEITEAHADQVDFRLDGYPGFVYLRDDVCRGAVWIAMSEDASTGYAEALAWAELQGIPVGCELDVLDWESGLEIWIRFERHLDCSPEDATADPLRREVERLALAWQRRDSEPAGSFTYLRNSA